LKRKFGVRQPIATIGIGVDIEYIASIKPSPHHSDVIYVGRLLSHKNVDVLIEAIGLLVNKQPQIKCIIIGRGPEEAALHTLNQQLGLQNNIQFMNNIEDIDDVYALMKSSKVFVLPSTREGFGIVVLEANACGLPVITTNHPDNAAKNLIHSKNGHQVTLSAEHIAQAIVTDWKNDVEVEPEHDWSLIVEKIEKDYQ
jgi:glycosyltransferase involved in cell wall biosynthesis